MSKRFASRTKSATPGTLRIAVFCGGRGATSILRALLRTPGVHLTVLVNAYDDGLSTGRLRGFVPGMLGASDFRKNLARLLAMSSPVQFAVADLLEYRFPAGVAPHALEVLVEVFAARAEGRRRAAASGDALPESLNALMQSIDQQSARVFHEQLAAFAAYARAQREPFSFEDCALGNLLLAGAYIANGRSFNPAVTQLARALHCRADVLNVTTGENRILVALKADGEILEREARIVGPQSPVPIRALYLLPEMLTDACWHALAPLDVEGRASLLAAAHRDAELSVEARSAIEAADVLVYGPGTQHSSLLPSYLTRGIADAVAQSHSTHRVFVVNLCDDHDTQGLHPVDLVRRALDTLGDPTNARGLITDILLPTQRAGDSGFDGSTYCGARVVQDTFDNPVVPGVHNGTRVVDDVRTLVARSEDDDVRLDIYVDLHRRSLAVDALLQEFVEIAWTRRFAHVHLRVNHAKITASSCPPHLAIEATSQNGLFSEIPILLEWLRTGQSRFLASLTGDGEYRLHDIELASDLLRVRQFGAILGARNQSKEQFFGSLRDAYAGRKLMHAASIAGGFGVSAFCAARFGLILSDPLTGFRVYDRLALPTRLRESLLQRPPRTTLEITGRLVNHGVEIAEIPVFYHYYPGFTDERWRLMRGLINALSVLR